MLLRFSDQVVKRVLDNSLHPLVVFRLGPHALDRINHFLALNESILKARALSHFFLQLFSLCPERVLLFKHTQNVVFVDLPLNHLSKLVAPIHITYYSLSFVLPLLFLLLLLLNRLERLLLLCKSIQP